MPESVRERIYEAIRDGITYGEMLPGERLTEKELSEKFQGQPQPPSASACANWKARVCSP